MVLILKDIRKRRRSCCRSLVTIQQTFYDNGASFVICELVPAIEQYLENNGFLEIMNVTPTESEAWDIVQMEEVESELLNGPDL